MPDTSSATSVMLANTRTRRTFRRWSSPRGSILAECIAHAPDRPDVARLGGIRFDLVANVADVHVDRPLVGLQRLVVAHQLEELRSRVHPPGAASEVPEEVELGGRQRDALAVAGHPPALEVDDEVAASQRAAGLGVGQLAVRAAEERLHPAHQLADAEWLDQVVI